MEYMEIQGGFLCCECNEGVIFECIFDLQAHYDVRHNMVRPQRFRCSVCRRFSVDKVLIMQHLMDHFQHGRYKCLKCDQTFPCKVDITHHLQQSHEVRMLFYCCKCGESFPSKMNGFKHARSRHNTCFQIHGNVVQRLRPASMEYMEIQGGFFCCVCNDGIIFQTTLDLKAHYDGQHVSFPPPQFVCSVCDLKSQSETFMSEHVQNHFMRKRFMCLECHETYHDDGEVKLHLQEAHGVPMRYSCSLCKDSYPSKLNVLRHAISKHSNYFRSGGRAANLVPQNVGQATALNVTSHAESSHSNFLKTQCPAVNPGQQDVGQPTALNITWHGESTHSPSVNLVPQDIGQTTALNVTTDTETSNNYLLQTQGLAVNTGHGDVAQSTGLNVAWHGESCRIKFLGTHSPSVNILRQDDGQTIRVMASWDTESSNDNLLQNQDLAVETGQQDVRETTSEMGATVANEAKCTTEDSAHHLPEWGTLEDWLEVMKQDMSQVEQSNECNASNSIDISLDDFFVNGP